MLHDKYLFPKADADALASFLTPMLRLHPEKRAKASELVHHNWLDGVMVQGEVDVIRRAEEEEAGRAGRRAARRLSGLDESEVDAMKPVEDVVVSGDGDGDGSREESVHSEYHAPRLGAAPVSSSAGAKENAPAGVYAAPGLGGDLRQVSRGSQQTTTSSSKRRS